MSRLRSEWIWHNGHWTSWDDATVHVSAHALHYGTTAFEGIRAYETEAGPALFRLRPHLDRLLASCRLMRMTPVGFDAEELTQVCLEVVARNAQHSCYIRPFVFRGAGGLGVDGSGCPIEVVVMSFPWGRYLGPEAIEDGIDATVSSWRRFGSSTLMPMAKIGGQYVNNQLVTMEASRNGYAEGIVLDAAGNVSEGSGENLFMVIDGTLVTPPLSASILGGITRDAVLTLARDAGIPIRTETISRDLLYLCDELFLTGTAAEITPVRSVDRLPVGNGRPGPITKQLQEIFFDLVAGRRADPHAWLTLVPPQSTAWSVPTRKIHQPFTAAPYVPESTASEPDLATRQTASMPVSQDTASSLYLQAPTAPRNDVAESSGLSPSASSGMAEGEAKS